MSTTPSRQHDREHAVSASTGGTLLDRLLRQLGFDAVFIDNVVGDLAQERGRRREAHGTLRTSAWYAWEVVRSLPHWITTGFRRGDQQTRLRIAGVLALVMSVATSAVIAYASRDGAPAMIVLGGSDPTEGVVVNHTEPTMLQTQVLDSRGHRLSSEPVTFRQMSGATIGLAANGTVHCDGNADATVRATVRSVNVDLAVHCRPVRELRTSDWLDFVVGDASRELPFVAVGTDGRPVTQLRGITNIGDTSIAAIEGARIQPRAAGSTELTLTIGNRGRTMRVLVHSLVTSFTGLSDAQRHVAISLKLARGDTATYALPTGVYWLKYLPRSVGAAPPSIWLGGNVNCGNGDGLREVRVESETVAIYCVVSNTRAKVFVAHGAYGEPVIEGALALDRVDDTGRP